MKLKLWLAGLLGFFCAQASAQQIELPLAGNVYSSKTYQTRAIGRNGINRWTDENEKFTAYFRTNRTGTLNLSLKNVRINGNAELIIEIGGKKKSVTINQSESEITVGDWKIRDTGYVAIEMSSNKTAAFQFIAIEALTLSGTAFAGNVIKLVV